MVVNNATLAEMIKPEYTHTEVRQLYELLESKGTFQFPALNNGLFPAAILSKEVLYTGYANVWVRDNVHVAHALWKRGETQKAVKAMKTLMVFFNKYRRRFMDIIVGKADPRNPMLRPGIRFNGVLLEELLEHWPHAQNDALGYFLWFYSILAAEAYLEPSVEDTETLELFPAFFEKIRYWQDEDNGHWEELPKIGASSIGTVEAGLRALRSYTGDSSLNHLIERGEQALSEILPWECIQDDPRKKRRYDSALLFLVYPLAVVDEPMAAQIVEDVVTHLAGEHGIRRYFGDSYYCPDYDKLVEPERRSADWTEHMAERDALLPAIGMEAQWCIFDPIVSVYFGKRYLAEGLADDYHQQVHYFNRSLGQITSEQPPYEPFRCPELYYLRDGKYIPNPHVPLLWTQANLALSFRMLEKTSAMVSNIGDTLVNMLPL